MSPPFKRRPPVRPRNHFADIVEVILKKIVGQDVDSTLVFLTNNPQLVTLTIIKPVKPATEDQADEKPQDTEYLDWSQNENFWMLSHPNLQHLRLPGKTDDSDSLTSTGLAYPLLFSGNAQAMFSASSLGNLYYVR